MSDLTPAFGLSQRKLFQIKNPEGMGGSSIAHPFQLVDRSTESDALAWVRYGTVMDVEPDNCETNLTLAEGVNTIYLHLQLDTTGEIVTTEILSGTTGQPDNAETNTTGDVWVSDVYATIGTATKTTTGDTFAVELKQAITHSLRFRVCGRVEPDSSAEPAVVYVSGTYHFWGF